MSARKVHGIWWHWCICVFVSLQLCICIPVVVVWQFLGKAQKEGARYQVTWQWLNSRWQDLPSHRSEPQIHISLRSWKESQCSRYQPRENHIFDYQLFSWGLFPFFLVESKPKVDIFCWHSYPALNIWLGRSEFWCLGTNEISQNGHFFILNHFPEIHIQAQGLNLVFNWVTSWL